MSLCYLQEGEGEDLVLLHGYLSSKESFAGQIAYFSRFFRVTAPDFPGMGGADPIPSAWSVTDYAAWTAEALSSLGISRPKLLAHSFGGRVAIKLLAAGLAERAVLTGCAGIVPRRTLRYHLRVKAYRAAKKLFPAFAERHFGSEEYRALSPLMRESYKKIVNEDLRCEAEKIDAPVLFLHGENDSVTPVSSVRVYLDHIRGAQLHILKGCGHFAFLDDAFAFDLVSEEFLRC